MVMPSTAAHSPSPMALHRVRRIDQTILITDTLDYGAAAGDDDE